MARLALALMLLTAVGCNHTCKSCRSGHGHGHKKDKGLCTEIGGPCGAWSQAGSGGSVESVPVDSAPIEVAPRMVPAPVEKTSGRTPYIQRTSATQPPRGVMPRRTGAY